MRLVDITSTRYAIARRYMIRLRRDDFEDPHEVAQLAATAQLTRAGVPAAVRVSGARTSRRRSPWTNTGSGSATSKELRCRLRLGLPPGFKQQLSDHRSKS